MDKHGEAMSFFLNKAIDNAMPVRNQKLPVCPKCGASPDGECGWKSACVTGMAEKKGMK